MNTPRPDLRARLNQAVRASIIPTFYYPVLVRDDCTCVIDGCGAESDLEAHHIGPRFAECFQAALASPAASSFDTSTEAGYRALVGFVARWPGIADPHNGVALCPAHHADAHAGTIAVTHLREIAERPVPALPDNPELWIRDRLARHRISGASLGVAPADLRSGMVVSHRGDVDPATGIDRIGMVERQSRTTDAEVMVAFLRTVNGQMCKNVLRAAVTVIDDSCALPALYRSRPTDWRRLLAHLEAVESSYAG